MGSLTNFYLRCEGGIQIKHSMWSRTRWNYASFFITKCNNIKYELNLNLHIDYTQMVFKNMNPVFMARNRHLHLLMHCQTFYITILVLLSLLSTLLWLCIFSRLLIETKEKNIKNVQNIWSNNAYWDFSTCSILYIQYSLSKKKSLLSYATTYTACSTILVQ